MEPSRHAPVPVRAVEHDRLVASGVPRVAEPVAVGVVEVVGLPCVRRHDDRLARLAECPGAEHERGEADTAVLGGEANRVDAARPVADEQPQLLRRVPVRGPREGHQLADGLALEQRVEGRGASVLGERFRISNRNPFALATLPTAHPAQTGEILLDGQATRCWNGWG